jgi:hypothetical protein
VKCAGGCGKRIRRAKKFYQTLNPFNKREDGMSKTAADIMPEIRAQAQEWQEAPEYCADCEVSP